MKSAAALLLATFALAGCTRSTVLLLPGENGADVGAVALLDEQNGRDAGVIDRANERATLGSRRLAKRQVADKAIAARDRRLLGDLPPPPRTFTLFFAIDSDAITPASRAMLDDLFAEVKRRPGVDVLIVGHTDRLGAPDYNDQLSRERAERVREQLLALGLDPGYTRAVGRGERDPPQRTADGVSMATNRRVDVVVR